MGVRGGGDGFGEGTHAFGDYTLGFLQRDVAVGG